VDNIEATRRVSSAKEPSQAEKLLASNRSKAKFSSWLRAKEDTTENAQDVTPVDQPVYRSEKYSDNQYEDADYRDHRGSRTRSSLHVPDTRVTPKPVSPDTAWDSEDETGEITAATLMAPEDLESRADDIIARVKGDLKLSQHSKSSYQEAKRSVLAVKSSLPVGTSRTSDDQNLASHVCPTCDKLMVCMIMYERPWYICYINYIVMIIMLVLLNIIILFTKHNHDHWKKFFYSTKLFS